MEIYNRNDVSILEDLYLKLRPYIRNHPNLNLWNEEKISICPNCGNSELIWKNFIIHIQVVIAHFDVIAVEQLADQDI